ncbi:MAG: hypothetical protein K8F92_14765 [Hyphomicrobium sp.]|uniref:hypothetical protein n=1 Tax=Hyphomicrobium sp. TaxID=82 RepID=UPI00132974A8|nr:hypothetical protein [Hyphomicrobium sp.]KAB2942940.1 MAG: hypothetical protein F9K20_05625 [Hyphomicrobium sp.]MBZ0210894.1 hypothetical protein [Hyphomicrobium sp.]
MSEEVDNWVAMFTAQPAARNEARKLREKAERRSQLTEAQRLRKVAVRTAQIGFRCSPSFFADVHGIKSHLAEQRGCAVSVADVLEEALDMLKRRHDYKGKPIA